MKATDFLEYFLVKERLADLSYQEIISMAKKGLKEEQIISDIYLARKLIYQNCKTANSREDLAELLDYLKNHVPNSITAFNPKEFQEAWLMTLKDIREQFEL